jgi:hypothetical protein
MKQQKPKLNKAAQAMRNAASAELHLKSRQFKTGAHDIRPKRERTRGTATNKAIKEQE